MAGKRIEDKEIEEDIDETQNQAPEVDTMNSNQLKRTKNKFKRKSTKNNDTRKHLQQKIKKRKGGGGK